jgi:putative transposase
MAPRFMLQLMQMTFVLVRNLFADRADLAVENLALRQQWAVLKRNRAQPRLDDMDRAFWMALKEQFAEWTSALTIVKPETVVRWHRDAFRRHWARTSARPSGRPGRAQPPCGVRP